MQTKKYFQKIALFLVAPLLLTGCSLTANKGSDAVITRKPTDSVWISGDAGKSWEAKNKPENKVSLSGLEVISLAVNPNDAKNAYVGLRGAGILKTIDGGDSWEYLNYQPEKVYGLDIDPVDNRILYASGVWQKRGKMYKSEDAGLNWKEIYTSADDGPLIMSLKVDKRERQTVYASTSDNQVIKSTDGGNAWKNIYDAKSPVLDIAIDRYDNRIVYLITQSRKIFRSKDSGRSFDDITKNMREKIAGSIDFTVLETDPNKADSVYLAGKVGIVFSRNAGDDWDRIDILNEPVNFPVRSIAINPSNPNEIIYGAGETVYRSVDGGKSWMTTQFNLSKFPSVIRYSPSDPNVVYLGFDK